MRGFRLRLCRCDRRTLKGISLILATIFNFGFGIFLILSILSLTQKGVNQIRKDPTNIRINPIEKKVINVSIIEGREIKSQYDYYFRIDYTIIQGACKPIEMFNTIKNLLSIEEFTNSKIQSLFSENLTIHIDIFSMKPTLIKSEKIQKNILRRTSKSVCDYLLQLSVGLDFPLYCNENCKSKEIQRLTSDTRPFDRQKDISPSSFLFYSSNEYDSTTKFSIQQIFLYQTSIFLDKPVYIRSFSEVRYVSALIVDPEGFQSSVTMSQIDRSLFLIKDGLYDQLYNKDSSIIYVSFLSTTVSNTYLRHENARIKLSKSDQSILFKQDSTFKLLFGTTRKDVIAFESINIPQSFIGVDPDSHTALVLTQPEQLFNDIELLDKRFLFKLVFNE